MLNLAILLDDSAREVPERTAVIFGTQNYHMLSLMQLPTRLLMHSYNWESIGEIQLP